MYSLVPGGAIIMCESVADFDENVPMPPMTEERQTKLMEEHVDKDPVMRAIEKLSVTYHNYLKPLMQTNYQPDDPESIFRTIDMINHSISRISEKTIGLISKMVGVMTIQGGAYCDRYCGDKFYAHAGLFLKNRKTIMQKGLGEYPFNVDMLSMFRGDWQISKIMDICMAKPELLDKYIDPDMFDSLVGSDRDLAGTFNDIPDLLSAFFEDTVRLARLERHDNRTVYLERLLDSLNHDRFDLGCCDSCGPRDRMGSQTVVRFISTVTRRSMQDLYEIQCDAVGGKVDVDLSKVLSRTLNMFGIVVMYIMYMAYQLRSTYCWTKAVDRYTDQLLAELKPN